MSPPRSAQILGDVDARLVRLRHDEADDPDVGAGVQAMPRSTPISKPKFPVVILVIAQRETFGHQFHAQNFQARLDTTGEGAIHIVKHPTCSRD